MNDIVYNEQFGFQNGYSTENLIPWTIGQNAIKSQESIY